MHTLGLHGNYAIPQHLQSALDHYGLDIRHIGNAKYSVESTDSLLDLDQICPPSIQRNGNIFDLGNLRKFAEFIHQPIRNGAALKIPEKQKPSGFKERMRQRKEHEIAIHENRTTIHRMLRFAITGSVEIPQDQEENLAKETAECHAATEQAIRNKDTWKSEIEFGNPAQKISAIPNTRFDLESGFHIQLFASISKHKGANQNALQKEFRQLLETATNGKYKQDTQLPIEIILSGEELEDLCLAANHEGLTQLINHVEFEEAVQEKLASIERRVSDISSSPLLNHDTDKTTQLHTLMTATSALSPVFSAPFMRNAWARYNFTERHASPLDGLQKEIQTFMAVCDLYRQNGHTNPAQMEAIATEFYSLIAFSGHAVKAIENGLDKETKHKAENTDTQTIRNQVSELGTVFHNASVAGVNLNAKFLSDEQRDTLETLQKHAGKPETLRTRINDVIKAPLSAGGETFIDFMGDAVNFIKEDPKIAASFIGLAGTLLYMNGGDSAAAQAIADYSTGYTFNEDGEFVLTSIDATEIPKDIFGDNSFHWDLKFSPISGYELYKHFANANFIVGPSQNLIELIRSNIHSAYNAAGIPQNYESAFDKTANAVINPLANKLFAVNMFQNVSHAAFWMWAFSRGYEHGPKGLSQLFELASPITNLTVQASGTLFDQFKSTTALSAQLNHLKEQQPTLFKYEGNFTPADIAQTLSNAAQQRANLEADLPEDLQPSTHTITIDAINPKTGLDGLSRTFKISAGNFKPTIQALAKLDHFMEHMASTLASQEIWHINHAIESIKIVQKALHDYSATHDITKLDTALGNNLEYILASELRYRGGRSHLYESLFEAAPDKQTFKRLMRSANTTIGQEKRQHIKTQTHAAMRGEAKESLTLTGHTVAHTKILGTNIWGGMVSTAKTLRRASDRTINKQNVIIGSGIAAACVGLDLAGAGNDFSNAVSGLTGGSIASATTIATFLNFNFWEDIIGVHLGTGIGLLFSGAASGYTIKQGIKPAIQAGLETTPGSYIKQGWNKASCKIEALANDTAQRITTKNHEWGDILNQKAAQAYANTTTPSTHDL